MLRGYRHIAKWHTEEVENGKLNENPFFTSDLLRIYA